MNTINTNAVAELKELLGTSPKIYGNIVSVAKSGMSRKMCYYVVSNNEILNIDYLISQVLDYPRDKKTGAIIKKGCGYDPLFHTVYDLSKVLYDKDYGIKYTYL